MKVKKFLLFAIPIASVVITSVMYATFTHAVSMDHSKVEVPPPPPTVRIRVEPSNISIRQGESGDLTVTVIALEVPGETEGAITSETAVFLHALLNPFPSFAVGILPEGVTATFKPPSVILQPRGEANSTLTLKVDSVAPPGTYSLMVYGARRWDDRTTLRGTSFYLTVYGDNPPPQRPFHELKVKMFLTPGVYLGMPNTVEAYSENYIRVLVWNIGSSREESVTVQIFVDGVKVQDKTLSLAGYPETYDTHSLLDTYSGVSKRWVPTAVRTYNITAVVFNPNTYARSSLEVTVIGALPQHPLTTLPLIMLTLLLGGALAIIWLTLSRRTYKAKRRKRGKEVLIGKDISMSFAQAMLASSTPDNFLYKNFINSSGFSSINRNTRPCL